MRLITSRSGLSAVAGIYQAARGIVFRSFSGHSAGSDRVEIQLDTDAVHFDRRWLRENCRCPECYNYDTDQRSVLYYRWDDRQLGIKSITYPDDDICITWQNGHQTRFQRSWLQENSHPGRNNAIRPTLWNKQLLDSSTVDMVPFTDYLSNTADFKRVLRSLLTVGFGIVTGVPATMEGTQRAAERMCFIQETLYGRMWSFTSDLERADTAYTNMRLGAHTDCTYLSQPIGIQVFHCLHHDGTGGETLLVDGFHAAEQLRSIEPAAFERLAQYPVYHENKDKDAHHVRSLGSILTTHPASGALEQIRFNHYDRMPISTIRQDEVGSFYEALAALSERIVDEENEFWTKLRPGMMVFVDNWRVLHGRAAFTGSRKVCGCYLPRDDWVGKARTLGLIH